MVKLFVLKSLPLREFSLFTNQMSSNYQLKNDCSIRLVVPLPPYNHSRQVTLHADPATLNNLFLVIRTLDVYRNSIYRMKSYNCNGAS